MVQCCVPGCAARGNKIFHAFPSNKERRQIWIEVTRTSHISEADFKGYAKICRYHFHESDFMINNRGQQGLKPDAVPRLRLPRTINVTKEHSYSSGDPQQKELWKKKFPSSSPTDFDVDVQNVECSDGPSIDELKKYIAELELIQERNLSKIAEQEQELRIYKKNQRINDLKLNTCNKKLKKVRQQLKQEKLNKNKVIEYLYTIFNAEQLLFFSMQIRNAGKKSRGRRYTAEEKTLSLMLYKHSPKTYRFMRRIFILPVKRTLGRHSAELLFGTGINTKIFEHITEKVKNMSEKEKYCIMAWDEVNLKAHLDYSISRDEIDGFVDLSYIKRPAFATHAMTFMIRGIEIPFKQAIGYYFTAGLKYFELVELVKLMLEAVFDTGLIVLASVCDQDSTNVKAVNQLINPEYDQNKKNKPATGLLQYKIGNTIVIHCYDPPHLIKGIRNNLETKKLQHHITKRWNITETDFRAGITKQPARHASWDDLKTFYNWSNCGSTKLLLKITPEHITPNKEKMKVCNATQVFSQTYGDMMLKYCTHEDLPKQMSDTAEILLFFNDLFDSVNGSSGSSGNNLKTAVSEKSVHFAFWEYALCMLSKMYFIENDKEMDESGEDTKKKARKNTKKIDESAKKNDKTGKNSNKEANQNEETGKETNRTKVIQHWTSTVLGYIEICKKCLNLGINEISLRNINQDGLENFFGCVRSLCQNRSSLITTHYRSAYTTKVVNNSVNMHSIKSNCEPDCSTSFLSDVHEIFLKKETVQNVTASNVKNLSEEILFDPIVFDPQFCEPNLNFLDNESICNISTTVCRKLMQAIKCDECRETIETSSSPDFQDNIRYPSDLFIRNFKNIFCAINDVLPHICHEKFVRKQLIDLTVDVTIDSMGCSDHFEEVNNKFKEHSVIFGILTFCKKVNDLLSAKNKVLAPDFNFIEELAYNFKTKKSNIGKYSEIFE